MTYQQKENSGSLFKNDKREKDTHPNARGSALIDGVEYWISSWTKETSDGQTWQSLSFKRKDAAAAPAPQPQRTHGQMKQRANFDNDDGPPF